MKKCGLRKAYELGGYIDPNSSLDVEAANAEKTARWRMDDLAGQIKNGTLGRGPRAALSQQLGTMQQGYNKMFMPQAAPLQPEQPLPVQGGSFSMAGLKPPAAAEPTTFAQDLTSRQSRIDGLNTDLANIQARQAAKATAGDKQVIGFAQGGVIDRVGEYWENDNAQFEKTKPSVPQRLVRALNPVTGFGSAVGAMRSAASQGDHVGMGLAAAQAIPVFGAMRTVPAVGAFKAVTSPSLGKTAAAVAGSAAGGAVADMYTTEAYAQGGTVGVDQRGFIKGPGGTDNVPARVAETGEEIRVGAGERIVNKEQNAALEALAAKAGMTLDEYLEASTQEPVGPTMKNGLRAAQQGANLDAPWYSPSYVRAANTSDMNGQELEALRAAKRTAPTNDPVLAVAQTGTLGLGATNQPGLPVQQPAAAKPVTQPAVSDPSYDKKEFRAAQGNIVARQELDNENIKGLRAAGVQGAVQGDVTVNGKTGLSGIRTIDTQNGKVYAGRDKTGQLHVSSNVVPGGLAAADKARDAEFEAKGYGKDGYGNWVTPQRIADKQALAQIERQNAEFDAFDASVTDPRAKQAGLMAMAMKYGPADKAASDAAAKAADRAITLRDQDIRLRGQNNMQGNADRNFASEQLNANTKDITSWMDTMVPTAGLKDDKLQAAQHKRAVLQQVMSNHWGGNVPADRQTFMKAQPEMARQAEATMRLYDVLSQQDWFDKWWRNNGQNPALTLQALSPQSYDQKSDTLTMPGGYKVKGKEIWGANADMSQALISRIGK